MNKLLTLAISALLCSELISNSIEWSTNSDILSTASQNASDARIGMDMNGDVVAIWLENGFVKSKTKLFSGNWSAATATLSNAGASSPRLVVDNNGNATAVWVESGVIKSASKTLNGSWSASSSISSSGASAPQMAVDVNGNIVAVWIRSTRIEAKVKPFGGNWSAVSVLSTTGSDSPQVAIGANGFIVAVWHDVVSSIDTIFSASRTLSGSWSAETAISSSTQKSVNPRVAVDANGNAIALWYGYDLDGITYSNVVVRAAQKPLNGGWSAPVQLSNPGIRNPANLALSVAFDNNGNAAAVWNQSLDGSSFIFESATKPYAENWTAAVQVVPSNLFANSLSLSIDSAGDALLAYPFFDGSLLLIQARESDIAGFNANAWSAPVNLSPGSLNASPSVVTTLCTCGLVADAVWINYDGANNVLHSLSGVGNYILPPTNLSVAQSSNNYGVFTEYFNTVTWSASQDPGVVGYNIYRDGLLIEQVAADVLSFVDSNTVQNGSVNYGVASIDNEGAQSKIITVNFP